MKVIQYNKANPALTIDGAKDSVAVDVGSFGPLTIAAQIVVSAASIPSGIAAQLQGSLDGTNYFDVNDPVTLSADGVFSLESFEVAYKFYRVSYSFTSGSLVATETIMVYGDRI